MVSIGTYHSAMDSRSHLWCYCTHVLCMANRSNVRNLRAMYIKVAALTPSRTKDQARDGCFAMNDEDLEQRIRKWHALKAVALTEDAFEDQMLFLTSRALLYHLRITQRGSHE